VPGGVDPTVQLAREVPSNELAGLIDRKLCLYLSARPKRLSQVVPQRMKLPMLLPVYCGVH
jgi:hypothetical protein